MTTALRGEPCNARTRAGGRCRKLVVGGGPCRSHGGNATQIRRSRERRIALAEALAADPRRDPAEVLADVLHTHDHLMRKAREEVSTKRPTAATMQRLMDRLEQTGRWAKTALDAEVDQRQTRALEAQAALLAGALSRILDRLELTAEQRELVHVVVPEELERLSPRALEAGSDG